jgi:hypothetical protein
MRYEKSMMWVGAMAVGAVLLGTGSAFADHRYQSSRTAVGGHAVISTGRVSVVLGGQYHRPAPVVVYRAAPAPICRPVVVTPRWAPPRPVVIHHYDRHRHDRDRHWRHDHDRGHDRDRGHWDRDHHRR